MVEMAGRYSRQALFPGIGPDGQQRVQAASAVLVGCGALGSLQADLLVRRRAIVVMRKDDAETTIDAITV